MDKAYKFLVDDVDLVFGDSIVVGVSGGPDSMALLHLLTVIKKEFEIFIVCAHVNHNVRKESEKEKEFLQSYCDNNGITFESMKIEDYGDDNFHNEARSKRYNYFSKIVAKYNAGYLLTAHHADDLIETILMRISRGSTLRGYSGFSKVISMGGYKILRPLIDITKDEILEYNEKNGIKYVKDNSNEKEIYTRNRYRKYVLPFFKAEDKNVHEKFLKFSEMLLEYNTYIDKQMKNQLDSVYIQNMLNVEKFSKLDHLIQQKIIYYILEHVYQDDLMLIYDKHAELILDLVKSKKPNAKIFLPNGIKVIRAYNNVSFISEGELPNNAYEIELIKYVNLPNGKNIEIVSEHAGTGNDIIRLNTEEIALPINVRTRIPGDKIQTKGMVGNKKVKDIFIDQKIPAAEREMWPIVLDSTGKILWIPDLKKSKYDKEKTQKYDIILRYY